jgi:formylglycine-generating enzyme required for sulfatase activity
MKKIAIYLIFSFAVSSISFANNLVIGTPTVSGSTVTFTIKWDNSWNVTDGPANWDAVWIFVKRQTCAANTLNPWIHADIAVSGHTVDGTQLQIDTVTDNKGVFIRRNAVGVGNITQATVTLTLSSAIGSDNIGVYGVEMVNVPQGEFYVGDGSSPNNENGFTNGNTFTPLLITQAMQTAGIGANTVYQRQGLGSTVALPGTFPLGYNRFYCMKYEVTTGQFVSFLNTLTYNQQLNLHNSPNQIWPASPVGSLFAEGFGYRIEISTPGESVTVLKPAVYGCDANNNNVFNENDDSTGVGYSFQWYQWLAYMDWAALRPMTEFEYEKACRGTKTPVIGEYAWGSTWYSTVHQNSRVNPRTPQEVMNTAPLGPNSIQTGTSYRAGIFATATSDRDHSGATYYGILDMSGGMFERAIGGWSHDFSSFTTANGDGNISDTGRHNQAGWSFNQYSARGASCNNPQGRFISSRDWGANGTQDQGYAMGGRGVRSY